MTKNSNFDITLLLKIFEFFLPKMEDNLDFSQPKKYQMFEFSRQKYRFLTKIELAKHVIFNLFFGENSKFFNFHVQKGKFTTFQVIY